MDGAENTTVTNDIEVVYAQHLRLLVGTAISRYGISEIDAQTLAHDVFLAYILKANEVRDKRAWLLGSICNASKHYLRVRGRTVALPQDIGERPDPRSSARDAFPENLVAQECLGRVSPRCQLALRLRYIEGYSVPEIALELDTSAKYAQKLVSRCLQQAQRRYAGLAE